MNRSAPRWLGPFTVAAGAAVLLLAAGFAVQVPWALALWPWPDGRLSYLFVASMLAAVGANAVWLGLSREWGAAVSGALNACVAFGAMALVLSRHGSAAGVVVCVAISLLGLVYLLWARGQPVHDARAMPPVVRRAFWVFVLALAAVSTALLLRVPAVFPWPLKAESSSMFGSMFLGSAAMFGYAATRARWHEAKGPLLAFLAYDLVLLPPFIEHAAGVRAGHLPSLVVYLLVLAGSAALALYYLLVARRTRG